jgi:broad specificity phosphatase PhoE
MTEIILVRHGQTKWNKEKIFRGLIDVPLNETGIEQAAAAGKILSRYPVKAVYSGPLTRAVATAQEIARFHQLATQIHDGFNDLDFGEWQGLSLEEVQANFPDNFQLWVKHPKLFSLTQGESLNAVMERAFSALEILRQQHTGQTIVIVTHRVVIKSLICALLGLDNNHFWKINQDNCAINIFHFHPQHGYVVQLINYTPAVES